MATAILSPKGQITIPAAVREKLGVTTGDRVEFVELADGQIALVPAVEDVRSLKGMIGKPRHPVSVEEASNRSEWDETMIGLDLLRAKPLVVEQADLVWQAKQVFAAGKADFADCLIERTGNAGGCEHTVTFDRAAARDAGMRMLEAGHD